MQEQTSGIEQADYSIPGFRIGPAPAESGHALVVRASRPQQGWIELQDVSHIISPTLHYRGRHWCIARVEETPDSVIYWLDAWPELRPVRKLVELSPEAWAEHEEEEAQLRRYRRSGPWAILIELAIAWLPRRAQDRIALNLAIRPERGVFLHCVVLLAATGYLMMIAVFTGSFLHAMLALYCITEAAIRGLVVISSGEPTGMLPLEAVDLVLRAVAPRQE